MEKNIKIIPHPQEITYGQGRFDLGSGIQILTSTDSEPAATQLVEYLGSELGIEAKQSSESSDQDGAICFICDNTLGAEHYKLRISPAAIQIIASAGAGWFYGVQSLKQLLASSRVEGGPTIEVPALSIADYPRFAWRAFMLDESRYFKGMEQVKLLLDEMALLKMNTFHWHLVDDQGWRIEIKKYPRLTEVGSKRASTIVGLPRWKCAKVGPLQWKKTGQSGKPHEGHYTQEQIKEIIQYAADRYITIIPEIEMPGHSSAAIASYPWLGAAKEAIEVPTEFGIMKDVYDVSDPKVWAFLTDVLDEVMALFPSSVIHIGGDEVKYEHWTESPSVQACMREKGLSEPASLQIDFTNRISQFLENHGRRMMGWNEILGREEDKALDNELAQNIIVHYWRSKNHEGDTFVSEAASEGYKIVNSNYRYTYLDLLYPVTPLSKSYAFEPIPEDLAPEFHGNILGVGCQMWSEWIPANEDLHRMVFPRITAIAETAWTTRENKDFERYKIALKHMQDHWRSRNIAFTDDPEAEGELLASN